MNEAGRVAGRDVPTGCPLLASGDVRSDAKPLPPPPPPALGQHVAGPASILSDNFFESTPGILKSYEFDYDAVTSFEQEALKATGITWSLMPYCWPLSPFCVWWFYQCGKDNVRDQAFAKHLAITQDGIKYVVGKRPAGCRLECQEVGKISKTVPYDKMTDCDIQEPAGSVGPCCYLVPRTLHTVHVDTASSGAIAPNGKATHELEISGLRDPEQFKRDVWAMKRGEVVDGVAGQPMPPNAVTMLRDPAAGGGALGGHSGGSYGGGEAREQTAILREVLEGIKETNALLKESLLAKARQEEPGEELST